MLSKVGVLEETREGEKEEESDRECIIWEFYIASM
jgi:hypothetical protein